MIFAAALAAAVTGSAVPAGEVAPTKAVAIERAIAFCEQAISSSFTPVPDAWDAYMDATDTGGRIKPFPQAPEIVRAVAGQFATGDRLKALFRQGSAQGDVWIGTVFTTHRCLVLAAGDKPGIEPYADFVLHFGLNRAGWVASTIRPNEWQKRAELADVKKDIIVAGFPVGAQQVNFFLLVTDASSSTTAPRP